MLKRMRAIGNSFGVIIDRALLDSVGIDRDGFVEISTDGKCLTIRPAAPNAHKTRVRASAARMSRMHHDTLRKLAQ